MKQWTEHALVGLAALTVSGLYVWLMLWLEHQQAGAGWMP